MVAQRSLIEQIVEVKFAEYGECAATIDHYSLPYALHHWLKKLSPDYLKVPKILKFNGQSSSHEHLAYYIRVMGELALEESSLL